MSMKSYIFLISILFFNFSANASQLHKIDFSTVEASYTTFYSAMSDYSKGVKTEDGDLTLRLSDALEVLEASTDESSPYSLSHLEDKAVLLKEIIDRMVPEPLNPIFEGDRVKGTNIFFIKKNNWFYISSYSLERASTDYSALTDVPYQEGILYPGASLKQNWLERTFPQGNQIKFLGVTQSQWIMVLIALALAFLLYYTSIFIITLLEKLIFSRKDLSAKIAKALTQPTSIFISAFFLKAAGTQIALTGNAKFLWTASTQVMLSIGCFWVLYCIITPLESVMVKFTAKTESELDDNLVPLVIKTARILIIMFAVLTTIQDLGVNIFSLLAGIGVGGLAIALAAKDTAANFFGSLMILFDQPFKVGDWIKIEDLEGTVEEIGFRSTRVRTFYDSLIIIPNAKIANSDIDNLGRRQFRRTVETLGLTYSTTEKQLKDFITGLNEIIKDHPLTRKNKSYVAFKRFGDSSLEILLYFFLNVSNYKDELIAKEEMFFKIKSLAEKLNVDFAFPSQSIYIEKK